MIVGLHNGHDACISIMDNGIILGHWELERLTGKKHIAGWFHKNLIIDILIQKILPQLQATIQDIEFICLSSLEMENHWNMTELSQILKNANKVNNLSFEWKSKWRNKEIKFFAFLHHLNHMAYSYYTCPWNNAFIFAYDGKGDFGSTTCYGIGKENKLQFISDLKNNKTLKNNYLGYSFSRLFEIFPFLGNNGLATAGKVMGLSSYGSPQDKWRTCIQDYIFEPKVDNLKKLLKLPNDPKSKDVQDFLATFQEESEKYTIKTIEKLMSQYPEKNIVLGGGCALNVLINAKIAEKYPTYIPPACSDSGQSLGCILYLWHYILNQPFHGINWHDPYLGETVNIEDYEKKNHSNIKHKSYSNEEEMIEYIVELLLDGKIIAWCQGRAEIGPRALGNRSILCSPMFANMKDKINEKIKHREWWRPFAPVALEGMHKEWFETDRMHPYMLESCNVKKDKINIIPAVTHIDGTARLQTVNEKQNRILFKLISKFNEKSGVPILLNTSLNDKGMPIANNCQEIIKLLSNTDLDYAVINNTIFSKKKIFL